MSDKPTVATVHEGLKSLRTRVDKVEVGKARSDDDFSELKVEHIEAKGNITALQSQVDRHRDLFIEKLDGVESRIGSDMDRIVGGVDKVNVAIGDFAERTEVFIPVAEWYKAKLERKKMIENASIKTAVSLIVVGALTAAWRWFTG